jgi:transcription termination/antitermination protein NusG
MIRMVKPMTRQKRWYAVHVMTGQEEKVKQFLERRARELRLEEKISRVVILKERDYYWKSPREKPVLPGYIIVEMVLDEETWNLVRRAPGVIDFVGVQEGKMDRRGVPIVRPLSDHEIDRILRMIGEETPRPRPMWHKGETVRIKSGPFVDTVGRIEEVNSQRQTLIVMINLLGRETLVEVDFSQVERVGEMPCPHQDERFFISRFTFYDPETFVVRVEKDERIEVGSEKERWLKERGFYEMARFGR